MTTKEAALSILDTKNRIKDTIEKAGVTVGDAPFADYPGKVALITPQYYGVQWDVTAPATSRTPIGNLALHVTRPVHAKLKSCILNSAGQVVYYLHPTTDFLRADGVTPSVLDGSHGSVQEELPEFYYKTEQEGNIRRLMLSTLPLEGFTFSPKMYRGKYKGSIQRSTGKLMSVINATDDFRGGNNNAAWDAQANSLLGKPATQESLDSFRAKAKAYGNRWTSSDFKTRIKRNMLWLVAYANSDMQLAYNPALTAEGYLQGGVGNGVTTVDYNKWVYFNAGNPLIPCGVTAGLGTRTGVVNYTLPFQFDSVPVGANFKGDYSASTAYVAGNVVNYNTVYYTCTTDCTGVVPTNAANWSAGYQTYKGVYNVAIAYAVNNFVSVDAKLYRCIQAGTGQPVTDAGYWTGVTRTVQGVPCVFGEESPFGDINEWEDGVLFSIQAADSVTKESEIYVCDNPLNYASTITANYRKVGLLPRASGYITGVNFGNDALFMPSSVEGAGASNKFWADYFFTNVPATGAAAVRGSLVSYSAHVGVNAGPFCVYSYAGPSLAYSDVGSRPCFIPE